VRARISGSEIARRWGVTPQYAQDILWKVYRKAGVNDAALLTRWAMQNGLSLEPETEETREIVTPKVYKQKIRFGWLRRARLSGG
jgi:hypothetical protein